MNKLIRSATQLMIWLKYRRHKFLHEGTGCKYRFLNSSFPGSDKISLGDDVHLGPGCMLDGAGGISIGTGTIFAPEVWIYSRTHNFDRDLKALPFDNVMLTAPVHIGEYVWIGARVIVLPGVSIGEGAVVGAGSVVSRDIPACAIAVGNPARVVKYRDSNEFRSLQQENQPFVYTRFGHGKKFLPK